MITNNNRIVNVDFFIFVFRMYELKEKKNFI